MALWRGQLRADESEGLEEEADGVGLTERAADHCITHETGAPHEPALCEGQRSIETDEFVRKVRVVGIAEDGRELRVRREEAERARGDGEDGVRAEELVQVTTIALHLELWIRPNDFHLSVFETRRDYLGV